MLANSIMEALSSFGFTDSAKEAVPDTDVLEARMAVEEVKKELAAFKRGGTGFSGSRVTPSAPSAPSREDDFSDARSEISDYETLGIVEALKRWKGVIIGYDNSATLIFQNVENKSQIEHEVDDVTNKDAIGMVITSFIAKTPPLLLKGIKKTYAMGLASLELPGFEYDADREITIEQMFPPSGSVGFVNTAIKDMKPEHVEMTLKSINKLAAQRKNERVGLHEAAKYTATAFKNIEVVSEVGKLIDELRDGKLTDAIVTSKPKSKKLPSVLYLLLLISIVVFQVKRKSAQQLLSGAIYDDEKRWLDEEKRTYAP